MDKLVLGVKLHDNKIKKKAINAVSSLSGVESVSVDSNGKKMSIIGNMDAADVVEMMRELCPAEILTLQPFGPAKEEPKKNEKKKANNKKIIESDDDDYTVGCPSCEHYKKYGHDDSSDDEEPNKDTRRKSKKSSFGCFMF